MAGAKRESAGKSTTRPKRRVGGSEPKHKVTAETRKLVETMVAYGVDQDRIAAHLGIGGATLRRRYRTIIDHATASAHAQVGQSLFQMATGSPAEYRTVDGKLVKVRDEVPRNITAVIFYAKTKMGFVDVQRHQVGGPEGKDGKATAIPIHLSGLSTGQLEDILNRIAVALESASD